MYEEWKDLYEYGASTVQIGKAYGKDPSSVGAKLRRMGVVMRSNKINSRRYKFENPRYFQKIDTEKKAYFLGFMYADGYVTTKNSDNHSARSFGVSISKKDMHILEDFKKELGSTHPVKVYNTYSGYSKGVEYVRLLIRNNDTCDDLISQGVVEKKTDIITRPKGVPYELIRHFIRGYIDGDGSIKMAKPERGKKSKKFTVSILGTEDILIFISEYFLENGLVRKVNSFGKRRSAQVVSHVEYGGNIQAQKILDHLYDGATVFLERKHNRYLMLKEQHSRIYA